MSRSLSALDRASTLKELQSTKFDVVVIGGGITGGGILRDASLRGLKVALIEAHDFSSGTSSKSTKLVHGGIRYLAMGHIHVVREAARERKRVHHIAPHLAEPKWLTLPSRNRIEWLKYKVGVTLYEQLGQVESKDRHFDVKGEALTDHEPLINQEAFPYATVYREYLTDDSRLVLGNVRAGVKAGGLALNKLEVTGLIKESGKTGGVIARCRLSGEEVEVRAKAVINAAGPWVESICNLDGGKSQKSLVLSKGVHIVVPKSLVPLQQVILTVAHDNRPVFLIPRGDVVYVGTTDSRHPDAQRWPEVLSSEVDYLLKPIAQYLNISLLNSDCVGSWAGLRPLISEQGKSTKEISRKDEIWVSESGMITIAGGKLTGYRKMAEDTVNKTCQMLGIKTPAPSEDVPLPGGDFSGTLSSLAATMVTRGASQRTAERLASLYGSEALEILSSGNTPVSGNAIEGEVSWAITEESAYSLTDVIYRRMRTPYYSPLEVNTMLVPVSEVMAKELGWTPEVKEAELKKVRARLSSDLNSIESTAGE